MTENIINLIGFFVVISSVIAFPLWAFLIAEEWRIGDKPENLLDVFYYIVFFTGSIFWIPMYLIIGLFYGIGLLLKNININ